MSRWQTVKAALRELLMPTLPDLSDDEQQSVDDATAARTNWIRAQRPHSDGGELQ